MILYLEKFLDFLQFLISYGGPLLIILFTLSVLVGLLKWSYKTKERLYIVSQNPILIIIWLGISAVLIILLYKYGIPLFKG